MAFEVQVSKGFGNATFYINEKVIRFDSKEVLLNNITGFSYMSTQTKAYGINTSKSFEINLWENNNSYPTTIRFSAAFGGGESNDKFGSIIDQLWTYFGNDMLNKMHQELMAGKVYQLTPRIKLTSLGIVVLRKPWFGKPYEVIGNWRDLQMTAQNGSLSIKSKVNSKARVWEQLSSKNMWLLYMYTNWLFKNSDVIYSLMAVPNDYKLIEKK
jgi:hypothetical protein